MPLNWADLIIEAAEVSDPPSLLSPWSYLVSGPVAVRFLNRFGCWFLQRPSGEVQVLDVFYGQLEPVARSFPEFEAMVNDRAWQQVYLLSEFVARLHASGKVATGSSCYAIAPPPAVGGPDPWGSTPLDIASVMVVNVVVLQALYSQVAIAQRSANPA